MESHLRETDKIIDDKIYKKLLREVIIQEDLETESECSTTASEDEYRKFKKILKRRGGKYLARTKGQVKVSDDSSDEDWLHQCLKQKRFKESKLDFLIKTVCNSLHLLFTFQSLLCFVLKNIVVDITRSRGRLKCLRAEPPPVSHYSDKLSGHKSCESGDIMLLIRGLT